MGTPTEQADAEWPELLRIMRERGADAVVDYVTSYEDPATRRALFTRAQRGFGGGAWEGRSLDAITTVVEAGIAEGIAQAAGAADDAERAKLTDFANVLSYNLAAALADCWPDDELPRETRHHEAGLRAADHCLAWRQELRKGPGPFSIAWWARGIHLLGLRRTEDAATAFEESLRFARDDARSQGAGTEPDAQGHWSVLLNEGYVAITERLLDRPGARDRWTRCLQALETAASARPDDAEDLRFTTAQLLTCEKRAGA
jgi:hypothetical protein